MIDIRLIRENSEVVKENIKKKFQNDKLPLVDKVKKLDEDWRKEKTKVDNLRHERNKISEEINQAKKNKDEKKAKELIKKAKEIPGKITVVEGKAEAIRRKINEILAIIPQIMDKSVPVGKDASENKVMKKVGKIPKFNFPVKNHVEILENVGVADFDASAETSGKGFYYLKNELGILNQAMLQFVINFMRKKGYTYIEPPLMVQKKVCEAAEDFEAFRTKLYKIEGENLYLIPTAEHAILGMLAGKTIPEEQLPLKFFGYSMCFRKEIGSHGINEKGLWRTHQFNKIELFIFCKPEDSPKYYEELQKNAEEIYQALEIPYRIFECCSGDLGDWKVKSSDLEAYRPTTKEYGEVGSLSNCGDYQARDLEIKGLNRKGERYVLHTLNNTAMATSRAMVSLIENNQQKDGSIKIPKVLWKYTGFKVMKKV